MLLRVFMLVYMIHASHSGGVSEWPIEHAWKACVHESAPWVRIPPPPYSSSKALRS